MTKLAFRIALNRSSQVQKNLAWAQCSILRWIVAHLVLTCLLFPIDASSHPLHSEAVERPCVIKQKGDDATSIHGECSLFLATGYLVFSMEPESRGQDAASDVLSGAINLTQSMGSIFHAINGELANGAVVLAENSPQIVHMPPGELAVWDNGYVFQVGGNPIRAENAVEPVVQNNSEPIAEVLVNFLKLGFFHIIPLGLDHILFIIGLFLLSPNLKTLLWQISVFTLAHTLTLALGSTGVIQVPSALVESLIALSILWIAIENLIKKAFYRWRLAVIFSFGLLHGLGFAGVLQDIGFVGSHFMIALLAFNLGVELGQLGVVLFCFLIFGWYMSRSFYHGRIVVPSSLFIASTGLYWIVERVVFL